MKKLIISPEQSLTFSDYFKLRARTEDILEYFGYEKTNEKLRLEQSSVEMPMFEYLSSQIEDHLVHISLENEITRREFLIASDYLRRGFDGTGMAIRKARQNR